MGCTCRIKSQCRTGKVVHSIVDILGLNPIATTIFDNVAAALAGLSPLTEVA